MKTQKWMVILVLLLGVASPAFLFGMNKLDLKGAWQNSATEKGEAVTRVLLFSGDYFSWTEYKTASGEFLSTKGGSWQMQDEKVTLNFEFNTADTAMVGKSEDWMAKMEMEKLMLSQSTGAKLAWDNIDKGANTDLTGAWLMGGRVSEDGKESRRDITVPRKTMKILTGTRFQWIAYNIATKQFSGTGGGTYTAKDGVYTENLVFFSRDNKRVGMSLTFNFDKKEGEWHHKGKSSAGDPMHEIWVPRTD
ncbi:MAG: membrane or secreted protein [Saprospiraceae bacterium]|nr:membrane or secreted protein [Saprospiraceae bacterium]